MNYLTANRLPPALNPAGGKPLLKIMGLLRVMESLKVFGFLRTTSLLRIAGLAAALFYVPSVFSMPPQKAPSPKKSTAVTASICMGCHSLNAHSKTAQSNTTQSKNDKITPNTTASLPSLAGQSASALTEKLLAYRADKLQGTLMNRIAKGYSETQLAAVAEFLSTSQAGPKKP